MIEVLGGCEMGPVRVLLLLIRGVLRDRAGLAIENLALRQQLVTGRVRIGH